MGILLFLIGLLAAGSGFVKLRRGARRAVPATYAVTEVVVGAAVILGSGMGLGRARPLAWTAVAATAVAVTVSSWIHVRRSLRERDRRAESEEARFQEYLEWSDP